MAEFVVKIGVGAVPWSHSFAASRISDIEDSSGHSNRNRRQKILQAVRVGTVGDPHAIADFFHARASGEKRKIRVAIAEAHAALTVGREHKTQTDGGHKNQGEQHHQ
jgi:hypothetical protein